MTQLIDSHCHLDFPALDAEREEILQRCSEGGMAAIVIPGVSRSQWPRLHQLVASHAQYQPRLFAAYGLHPYFTAEHQPGHVEELDQWLDNDAIAVGEIGLDAQEDDSDLPQQIELFRQQLSVARNHRLPVIVHARKTQDLVLKYVRESHLETGGILHAFSGSLQQAERAVDMGFKIGFGGAASYERAHKLHRILRALPKEAIVFETDAPDIPPPFAQGEYNRPDHLFRIVELLADVRQEPVAELWRNSTENVCKLFGLNL
ncbi:MAG: TatD family hydrolase [Pseudomonadota bacterium]|nr:DNAase [Pseudomonadales bacterium]MDY6921985.1 TatD family hydrolase [Pseudomonadota bacterium]